MAEEKKPSSLRSRVDRARKSYAKPMNPVPIIVGVVVVALCGIGLYLAFRGGPVSYSDRSSKVEKPKDTPSKPASRAAEGTVTRAPLPSDPKQAAFALCNRAKQDARTAPEAAMNSLREGRAKYPDYAADFYHAMAMVTETRIQKSGGNNAPRGLLEEKVEYLLKAKAEIDAGKQWVYDPIGNRTGNLDMSIQQAQKEIERRK